MDAVLPSYSDLLSILKALPDPLVVVNNEGIIVFVNRYAELLFIYKSNELVGKKIETLIPNRYRHAHLSHRANYFNRPKTRPMGFGIELYGLQSDGTEIPVSISLAPLNTDEGQFIIATIIDISIKIKMEQSEAILSTAFKFIDDAIISINAQGNIILWNKGAEQLFLYSKVEAIGQPIEFICPIHKRHELKKNLEILWRGEKILEYETERMRKDGKIMSITLNISPVFNAQHKLIGAIAILRDITRQKLREKKLKYLAEHDRLTGLINPIILKDRISQGILWSKRYQRIMAVCFIDLDNFKSINDTYGHATGDALLNALASRLRNVLRKTDSIARVGGDEFVILFLDLASEDDAIKLSQCIFNLLENPIQVGKHQLKITLSMGLAFYPKDGELHLIEKADAAMYYAKNHGKNSVHVFNDSIQL